MFKFCLFYQFNIESLNLRRMRLEHSLVTIVWDGVSWTVLTSSQSITQIEHSSLEYLNNLLRINFNSSNDRQSLISIVQTLFKQILRLNTLQSPADSVYSLADVLEQVQNGFVGPSLTDWRYLPNRSNKHLICLHASSTLEKRLESKLFD